MLVLSRKIGQSLVIDGKTVIHILEVRGNKVRVGIEATADVLVMRSELLGDREKTDAPRERELQVARSPRVE
jgi:carbon storage regulator